jgi:hypothetical protein
VIMRYKTLWTGFFDSTTMTADMTARKDRK